MNRDRRKQLDQIETDLRLISSDITDNLTTKNPDTVRNWQGKISDLRDMIEAVKDDEQEAYDNRPTKTGDAAEQSEAAIDAMDEAMESLDSAMNEHMEEVANPSLQEAVDAINSAADSVQEAMA